MSKAAIALAGAALIGAAVVRRQAQANEAPEVAYYIRRTTVEKQDNGGRAMLFGLVKTGIDAIFSGDLFRPKSAPVKPRGTTQEIPSTVQAKQVVRQTPVKSSPLAGIGRGLDGLLNMIGGVEAPKGYNQVYGGISRGDQPPKPLTQMTVDEVLAWQDSIDRRYPSEAAGRYQIMEDTLRGLKRAGHVRGNELFSVQTQDKLAVTLMEGRGLSKYRAGSISAEQFAQNLSKEWASLPAITKDKRGRAATGQSYYAGDGLNRSHLTQAQILQKVRAI